jgi:flagellar hook-length control protein FliK
VPSFPFDAARGESNGKASETAQTEVITTETGAQQKIQSPLEETSESAHSSNSIPQRKELSATQSLPVPDHGVFHVQTTAERPEKVEEIFRIGSEFVGAPSNVEQKDDATDQSASSEQRTSHEERSIPSGEKIVTSTQQEHQKGQQHDVTAKQIGLSMQSHQAVTRAEIVSGLGGDEHLRKALPDDFARNLAMKVADDLRLHIEGKTSEVRVVLKPESLGELSIRVAMEDGRIAAQLNVKEPAVKAALEAQIPQLRETLSSHGIEVNRLEIVLDSGEMQFSNSDEGKAFQHRPRSKRATDVDAVEEFETVKSLGYNTIEYII